MEVRSLPKPAESLNSKPGPADPAECHHDAGEGLGHCGGGPGMDSQRPMQENLQGMAPKHPKQAFFVFVFFVECPVTQTLEPWTLVPSSQTVAQSPRPPGLGCVKTRPCVTSNPSGGHRTADGEPAAAEVQEGKAPDPHQGRLAGGFGGPNGYQEERGVPQCDQGLHGHVTKGQICRVWRKPAWIYFCF